MSDKPVILLLACTDGELESQEFASIADVKPYPAVTNCSEVSADDCSKCVAIMVGVGLEVDTAMLNRCPKLRIVVRTGIGYDDIDIERAGCLGIAVCHVPNYGVEEVADTAIAHVLALFRQTTFLHEAVKEGKMMNTYEDYRINASGARRIRGKTMGLIGLGNTGIAVALRARSLGFNIIYFDPYTSHGLEKAVGGIKRYDSVSDVISRSDCVSLHCMLTDETKHMINATTLKLFKKDAFLVNVSRGMLIDGKALAEALKEGRIGGAALDVHEEEPLSYESSPLKGVPNLICTPHSAWYSKESFMELRESGIQRMKEALTGLKGPKDIPDCVNKRHLIIEAGEDRWQYEALK